MIVLTNQDSDTLIILNLDSHTSASNLICIYNIYLFFIKQMLKLRPNA